MKKDAFYFPHFANSRNDNKIMRMRLELGLEGYAIYFMLLEVLREQNDFKYPLEDIDLLANEFGTSEQKVRVVVSNYGLFDVDENEMAEEEYENEDKSSPPATFLPKRGYSNDEESDEDDDDESDGHLMDNQDEIEEGGRDSLANLSNNNMKSYPEDEDDILEDQGIVRPDKEKRKKMSAITIAKRVARKTNM